jgi:hypothetical protein
MSSTDIDLSPAYRWVKLPLHCAATGDTPDAVHARRRKRLWKDGVHCRVGPDGNLYVNPEAYNKWVEGNDSQANSSGREG